MNMIAGAKVSIVDPTPGVTRDRVTAIVELHPPENKGVIKTAEFVDTGGFGVYVAQGERYDEVGADLAKLTDSIEFQISQAVENADLVLFVVDAQQGVTAADREIARLLRERGLGKKRDHKKRKEAEDGGQQVTPPVRVVANKVDGPKWEAHAPDISNLGMGDPIPVSAKTNYFRRDFLEAVWGLLPEPDNEEGMRRPPADLAIAIIGKRNAGKSTLVNALAGEPRMIVSEIAGTTRDAVDVRFEQDGRTVVVIDTAGLRRKRSFQSMIEHYAFDRVQRAVQRADVVLLMLDATAPISQVDEHLAQLANSEFKPVIIVVNKWDLAEGGTDAKGRPATPQRYEEYIRKELGGLSWAPIAFMSASQGGNVREVLELAFDLRKQASERVTTGKLNRMIRAIVERRGPVDPTGRMAKVYYVAQTGVEPPTITLVVNHPEMFRSNYLRFLTNRLREELPFKEVPMRLVVRARRQREDDLTGEDRASVKRGRKGLEPRARRERTATVAPEGEFGEDLLTDDKSMVFDTASLPDDPEEYFDDE